MKNILSLLLMATIFTLGACKKTPPTVDNDDDNTPPPSGTIEGFPTALVDDIETELGDFFDAGDDPSTGITKLYNSWKSKDGVESIRYSGSCMVITFDNGMRHGITVLEDSSGYVATVGGYGESEKPTYFSETTYQQERTVRGAVGHIEYFDNNEVFHFSPSFNDLYGASGYRNPNYHIKKIFRDAADYYGRTLDYDSLFDNDAKAADLMAAISGTPKVIFATGHGYLGELFQCADTVTIPFNRDVKQSDVDALSDPYQKAMYQKILDKDFVTCSRYRFDEAGNYIKDARSPVRRLGFTPQYLEKHISNDNPKLIVFNSCYGLVDNSSVHQFIDVFKANDKISVLGWTDITHKYDIVDATRRIFKEIYIESDTTGDAHLIDGQPVIETVINYMGGGLSTSSLVHVGKTNLTDCHCPETVTIGTSDYKVAQVGYECWMAENLLNQGGVGLCYDNVSSNCTDFGALFTQAQAMAYAPTGWKLASDMEWRDMEKMIGLDPALLTGTGTRGTEVGNKLKAAWSGDSEPGYDLYGFNALAAGNRQAAATGYTGMGSLAAFWTSTNISTTSLGYYRKLFTHTGGIWRQLSPDDDKYSVRYVGVNARP